MAEDEKRRRHAEYMRKWRAEHRERARELGRTAYYKKREYYLEKAKEYYLKNKEKVLNYHKQIYNPEKKRAYNKEWWQKYKVEIRMKLEELFGKECVLCGDTTKICYHQKYGQKHPSFRNKKNLPYFEAHKEDFVPLCRRCHTGVHFCMDVLGYTWEEIREIATRRKTQSNLLEGDVEYV